MQVRRNEQEVGLLTLIRSAATLMAASMSMVGTLTPVSSGLTRPSAASAGAGLSVLTAAAVAESSAAGRASARTRRRNALVSIACFNWSCASVGGGVLGMCSQGEDLGWAGKPHLPVGSDPTTRTPVLACSCEAAAQAMEWWEGDCALCRCAAMRAATPWLRCGRPSDRIWKPGSVCCAVDRLKRSITHQLRWTIMCQTQV